MRFLADENVDREIVVELISHGYKVAYVAEMEPGISDDEFLSQANRKRPYQLRRTKTLGKSCSGNAAQLRVPS